ncbi:MAG: Hsp20/alpha crystallin family protein [Haliscomenobacter sp.]|nr:Hsp20/alpha crystallin family protein [Haliscomenobacter sp.]MBK7476527.1 Hsp20/alpha crystallin family protein [Haliscomenobacter sp.]
MWRAKIHNHAFDRMGEYFARLIDRDHFLSHSAFDVPSTDSFQHPANVVRKDGLFELRIATPGYAREEIEVIVEGDVLKVRGEKNEAGANPDEAYILEAFDFYSFEHCFKLSPKIAHEKMEARYENGILTLVFRDAPVEIKKTHTKIQVA